MITKVLILFSALALSGCAQITYTVNVTGESNKVTCTWAVDKRTADLFDMAGSAYGDATGGPQK